MSAYWRCSERKSLLRWVGGKVFNWVRKSRNRSCCHLLGKVISLQTLERKLWTLLATGLTCSEMDSSKLLSRSVQTRPRNKKIEKMLSKTTMSLKLLRRKISSPCTKKRIDFWRVFHKVKSYSTIILLQPIFQRKSLLSINRLNWLATIFHNRILSKVVLLTITHQRQQLFSNTLSKQNLPNIPNIINLINAIGKAIRKYYRQTLLWKSK